MMKDWKPMGPISFGCLLAGTSLVVLFHYTKDWVPILDHANLIFHEAGHPIFGLLGDTMQWLGGTLGQLAFPVVATIYFYKRKESLSFALTTIWIFQNLFNIARYMGDARAQMIPLIGGEHDWNHIFGAWGLLSWDTKISSFVRLLGWVGIISIIVWSFRLWQGNKHQNRTGNV